MEDGTMVAIETKGTTENDGVVRVELEYSVSELRQLIRQLPSRHPLVSQLKRQLKECADKQVGDNFSTGETLTYLAERLNVGSAEGLLSKALSFVNMGLQLEDRGYEILAVKKSLFSKEVIKFNLQGG
jgi:hypothetical protein